MKWEQLLNENISEQDNSQVLTNIECPECGRNIYLNNGILITTYPAKYHYWCSCGWTGNAHVKWTKGLAESIRQKTIAVETVKCKNCVHVYYSKTYDNYWCERLSGVFLVEPDGFCKWGR